MMLPKSSFECLASGQRHLLPQGAPLLKLPVEQSVTPEQLMTQQKEHLKSLASSAATYEAGSPFGALPTCSSMRSDSMGSHQQTVFSDLYAADVPLKQGAVAEGTASAGGAPNLIHKKFASVSDLLFPS